MSDNLIRHRKKTHTHPNDRRRMEWRRSEKVIKIKRVNEQASECALILVHAYTLEITTKTPDNVNKIYTLCRYFRHTQHFSLSTYGTMLLVSPVLASTRFPLCILRISHTYSELVFIFDEWEKKAADDIIVAKYSFSSGIYRIKWKEEPRTKHMRLNKYAWRKTTTTKTTATTFWRRQIFFFFGCTYHDHTCLRRFDDIQRTPTGRKTEEETIVCNVYVQWDYRQTSGKPFRRLYDEHCSAIEITKKVG